MRASVAENKCDDLAAMYQLLLSPASGQFSWPGPRAGCDNQSVYSEANTTLTSNSGLYVKMRHLS